MTKKKIKSSKKKQRVLKSNKDHKRNPVKKTTVSKEEKSEKKIEKVGKAINADLKKKKMSSEKVISTSEKESKIKTGVSKKSVVSHKVSSEKINIFGMQISKEDLIIRGSIIALTLFLLSFGAYYQFWKKDGNSSDELTKKEAEEKAEEFINENLLSEGMTASITEITEEYDLYKLKVDIGTGQEIESFISKDGKTFFSSAMDIEEIEDQTQEATANNVPEATEVEKKSDKPKVEVFVMSHCPYGTQIEKGIIPVVETLGDKIDFQLKFVDYAMHGQEEIDEQLNQYCIDKEYNDKLIPYLNCFLEDETKGDACMDEVGINKSKIASCSEDADKEFKISESYEDQSQWKGSYPPFNVHKDDNEKYGVEGSPTLIINETKISAARDSASLLGTICSAFNDEPEECQTDLPSTSPSAGFGSGSGSGSAGSCG